MLRRQLPTLSHCSSMCSVEDPVRINRVPELIGSRRGGCTLPTADRPLWRPRICTHTTLEDCRHRELTVFGQRFSVGTLAEPSRLGADVLRNCLRASHPMQGRRRRIPLARRASRGVMGVTCSRVAFKKPSFGRRNLQTRRSGMRRRSLCTLSTNEACRSRFDFS